MPSRATDRNLLVGVLAIQLGIIRRDQLITAMQTWVQEKTHSLESILAASGAVDPDAEKLLENLVARQLSIHGGNPERSLDSTLGLDGVSNDLHTLLDPDIEASLARAANRLRSGEAGRTQDIAMGTTTSNGHRFRVLRPHAKGGLGEVFVAHDEELHREVALKQIQRHYADQAESRSRFTMEAEITGGLEHPGIVPVYGLGQYADGRPFYAMRFIRGESLKEAADRFHGRGKHDVADRVSTSDRFSSLDFRELLRRFIDVCNAIQYAHSRGVVHRDLKPANIMLGNYGETLVVDWGLAKAMGRREPAAPVIDETLLRLSVSGSRATQVGAAIGTPAFMSPEQAAGHIAQVGPASDVYSLGATLYYVLTAQPPVDREDLVTMLRKVRAGQFLSPRQRNSAISKPLEAICLKAMSLSVSDRYGCPRDLADDVERYLADEPVVAHVDSFVVKGRRWVRKHPKLISTFAATILGCFVGTSVIAAVINGANQKLAKINVDLSNAIEAERLERERAEAVSSYMVNAFRTADPTQRGSEVTVAEVLQQAVDRLDEDFRDQPLLKARMLHAIGETYRGLGLLPEYLASFQAAYDLRRTHLGESEHDTHLSLQFLARAYQANGDLVSAYQHYDRALAGMTSTVGENHPDALVTLNSLAQAYIFAGKARVALPLLEQGLERSINSLDENDPVVLSLANSLGRAHLTLGNTTKAVQLLGKTLDQRLRVLGNEHPDTLTSANDLALAYQSAGKPSAARELLEDCLDKRGRVLGQTHPDTLKSMHDLAVAYQSDGRWSQSLALHKDCLERRRRTLGEMHPDTRRSAVYLAIVNAAFGDAAAALPELVQNLQFGIQELGDEHPDTIVARNGLAMVCLSTGQAEQALPLLERNYTIGQATFGEQHPDTLAHLNNLAWAHKAMGNNSKAVSLLERCLANRSKLLGHEHPDSLSTLHNLAVAEVLAGQKREGLSRLKSCLETVRSTLGDSHPLAITVLSSLGHVCLSERDAAGAAAWFDSALALSRKTFGDDFSDTVTIMHNLGLANQMLGNWEQATALYRECLERRRRLYGDDNQETLSSLNSLAFAYQAAGEVEMAIPLYQECLEKRRSTLGDRHLDTLTSTGNLAAAYLSIAHPDSGLPLVAAFVNGHRERSDGQGPDFASALMQIAEVLRLHGHYESAANCLTECLSVARSLGADPSSITHIKLLLCAAVLGEARELAPTESNAFSEKMSQADALLLECFDESNQLGSSLSTQSKDLLVESISNLIQLRRNEPDAASAWQSRLDRLD